MTPLDHGAYRKPDEAEEIFMLVMSAAMRLLATTIALLLLAACGEGAPAGDGGSESTSGGDVQTSPSGVEVSGDLESKPEITIPDADPPTELEITDLVEGDGAEVAEGATVTAHYVGVSWSTGKQFDASWDRGEPTPFSLSQVIPGWTQGLPGMKVGGRRLLVIPPDMAYADNPPTPDIKPGETLVFVVDMVETQ